MAGNPTEKEGRLLDISKAYDDAYATGNVSQLDSILRDDVRLVKDCITLLEDVKGKDAVKQYVAAYSQKYSFTHNVIAGAVDEKQNVTFSFWHDKDVRPKSGKFDEDLPQDARTPSDTVGIHHLMLDDSEKVKEIAIGRQLSKDEVYRKLKKPPPQRLLFDPESFRGSGGLEPSRERMQKMHEATKTFNDMWTKFDASLADKILARDVHQYEPLVGIEVTGLEDYKKLLTKRRERFEHQSSHAHVAATAGNKSFVHWMAEAKNKQSGATESLYGLEMLTFNGEAKITHVVHFRQPTKDEQQELLKEPPAK